MRSVPLKQTEETLLNLREAAGLHSALVKREVVSDDEARVLARGAWLTLVAYAEFFVDGILDSLFKEARDSVGPGANYLLEKEESTAFKSWEGRKSALSGVFGINLGGFKSWQPFDGAIWVRNSIAHGGGALTRMQRQSEIGKADLVGVSVVDGQLEVNPEAIRVCSRVCCAFVEELDASARGAGVLQVVM